MVLSEFSDLFLVDWRAVARRGNVLIGNWLRPVQSKGRKVVPAPAGF